MRSFTRLVFLITAFILPLVLSSQARAQEDHPEYYSLSPQDIVQYIGQYEARAVIFIYASWCPYCREKMPGIMTLAQEKPGAVIAVSIDKDEAQLKRYMASFEAIPFHFIRVKEHYSGEFKEVLARELGINHPGSIPYMAFRAPGGEIVLQGNYGVDLAREFIFEAN